MKVDYIDILEKHEDDLIVNLDFVLLSGKFIQEKVITKDEYQIIIHHRTDSGKARQLIRILKDKKDENIFNKFIQILSEDYSWLSTDMARDMNGLDEPDFIGTSAHCSNSLSRYQNALNEQIESQKVEVLMNNSINEDTAATCISRKRNRKGELVQKPIQTVDLTSNNPTSTEICVQNNEKIEETAEKKVSQLSQVITPEMMTVVRKNHRITNGWTKLAHSLGLSHQVTNIRTKVYVYCEDIDICVVYLLREWVGNEPKTATLGKLLDVLKDEGFNDVADELETKFVSCSV